MISANCLTSQNFDSIPIGAQWGDEGKGKVVDMLATDVDVVCRCQVSNYSKKTVPNY